MKIELPPIAHEVLVELAWAERRTGAAQAEHFLIAELHRRGLVTRDGTRRPGIGISDAVSERTP